MQTKERTDGALVAADGRGELRVNGVGRYRVVVESESVPKGYAASGAFRLGPLDESGVAGSIALVQEGRASSVELTLFKTSGLSGLVTGPDGAPLAGATVRAQGLAPGLKGLFHDTVTGSLGSFEFDDLLPFVYGVSLVDEGPSAESPGDIPRGARQLFDLAQGPFQGVHLSVGTGPVTLSGRVVDELGGPFAGVGVRAYYAGDEAHGVTLNFPRVYDWSDHAFYVRTDARGEFRVKGVQGVPIRIQVGADVATNGPGRRAKFVPEPVEIRLDRQSQGPVNVGSIELERSRRFTVEGQVTLADAAHPDLRLRHSRMELRVHPYEPLEPMSIRPGREVQPSLEYHRQSGRFTLSCDASLAPCAVTLALRGHPELDKEYHFYPEVGGTLTGQVLSFP